MLTTYPNNPYHLDYQATGSTFDQFHFVYHAVSGDGALAVRALTQARTNTAAKTGLMLRSTTDPASPFYAVPVTPGNGVESMWRTTPGAVAGKTAYVPQLVPVFLKLARSGSSFSAYYSIDGVTYCLIPGSTQNITMPADARRLHRIFTQPSSQLHNA